ncbi:hypothetical protein PC116_g34595, partial [Phytophthora cactorum]
MTLRDNPRVDNDVIVEVDHKVKGPEIDYGFGYVSDGNAVHGQDLSAGESVYAKLQRFAGKFGVEQRGIERVPSDERTDSSLTQVGTL